MNATVLSTPETLPAAVAAGEIYPCVVSVNVDVETEDAKAAGKAGLFGRYSYGRYGAREGIWRILNVLQETGVRATFFINLEDARRHPAILDAILDGGHELAAQGVLIEEKQTTTAASLELPGRIREGFVALSGRAPVGWRCSNGLLTADALAAVSVAGYDYDSSFQDDDMPYVFDGGNQRRLVELPVWDYLTDSVIYMNRHSHERVRKIWHEEFDALYDANAYTHLTLHSRGDIGSGRTVRANVVREFLLRALQRPRVQFFRCDELADIVSRQGADAEPIPRQVRPAK